MASVLGSAAAEEFSLPPFSTLVVDTSKGSGVWRYKGATGFADGIAFALGDAVEIGPFCQQQTVRIDCVAGLLGISQAPVIFTQGGIINISRDHVIGAANAEIYNGKVLVFSSAFQLRLNAGLPLSFGFSLKPPASGNASIVSDGTATLNGATATLTRAGILNLICAVVCIGRDQFVVTGG